jgi:pimeloyl-ACP methyl ester carboxylesterase
LSSAVRRHFVTVGRRQVHYRRAGAGPVVAMLHISPLSSRTFVPVMERLADQFTLIALDTPGYGSSDPLALPSPAVADYALSLREVLDALGVGRVLLYARATGTTIATEFARQNPDRAEALVVENLAMIGEDQREMLKDRFAPSFDPEWDGSHLLRAWSWWRNFNLFWPWFDRRRASRQGVDIPAAASIHEDVMDLLRSGPGYRLAPDAVFRYSPLPALAELKAPMTVFSRAPTVGSGGSSIEWLDRLLAHAPSITVERYSTEPFNMAHQLDPGSPAFTAYVGKLRELFERHAPSPDAPPVVSTARLDGRISRSYVATPDGDLLLRQVGEGRSRPVLLLHDFPRSSASLSELALGLAPRRLVLTPDLPGFGESDRLSGPVRDLADYLPPISAQLDTLGIREVDVYGTGAGGLIAAELAAHDGRVKSIVLDDVPLFTRTERDLLSGCQSSPVEPCSDGTHLIRAWARVQDASLFWPWCNRTRDCIRWDEPVEPDVLHERTLELLEAAPDEEPAQRAAIEYPVLDRLRGLRTSKLITNRKGGGERFERLSRQVELRGADETVELPGDRSEAVRAFESFLDRA